MISCPVWGRDLTTRATGLDREMSRLTQLDQTWVITLARAESTQTAPAQGDQKETTTTVTPPEILQRMQSVIVAIKQAREAIQKRRTQILTLQNRVAEQETRIAQALASVGQVRDETISRLFVKDSPGDLERCSVVARRAKPVAGQPELLHRAMDCSRRLCPTAIAEIHS